jgi:predicted Zn-dependent protease
LLFDRGHAAAAAQQLDQAVSSAPGEASVRWRAARAWLGTRHPVEARERLGELRTIDGPSGPWFALRGRLLTESGARARADRSFQLGIALDPLSELVACEGHWSDGTPRVAAAPALVPRSPERRALCEAARQFQRRD